MNVVSRDSSFSIGLTHEFMLVMKHLGFTPDQVQRIVEERPLANALYGELAPLLNSTTSWRVAQEILGNRAISIDVGAKRFCGLGCKAADFQTVPFSVAELEAARDSGLGMVLVATPDVAFSELFNRQLPLSLKDNPRAASKCQPGYLLTTLEMPASEALSWEDQMALRPDGMEEVEITHLAYALWAMNRAPIARHSSSHWTRVKESKEVDSHFAVCIHNGELMFANRANSPYPPKEGKWGMAIAFGVFRPLLSCGD